MKNIIYSCLILLLFLLFVIFTCNKNKITPVLNIITPVQLEIDLNNNGKVDDNETICIADTESFSLESREKAPDFARKFNLTLPEIIALGYMADNFSNKTLISNPVKVKLSGESTHNCRFAEIYVYGEKYSEILKDSGFAAKNGIFSSEKFNENLKLAKNLDLVLYNIKSGKYHKTDCPYGLMSSDYSIIPKKLLPPNAAPCKFCHVNTPAKINPIKVKNIFIPKETVTSGNIKLILTDYTQKLKPDKLCNTTACKALVTEINNAQKTIDIAVYGIDDIPKIHEALVSAKLRNVKIRMVYDKSFPPSTGYYKETEKIAELANEINNDYVPEKPAFTNKLMHNKFFIFDNETVLTGSMNISSTGLSDYNSNAVIIINSKEMANLYTAEFEQMLSGKFHELKKKTDFLDRFVLNDSKISVYFSPYDKSITKIIPIIDNAKQYIYIPAFLITHKELADSLIRAKQRKVDVKIIIDANSTSTKNTKHKILRQNNIKLKTENYAGRMHSKSIIIDDKYIIIGSMNFSNSGETRNDENLLVIENSTLAKEYKTYFLYLWTKIPEIYLTRNAKAEGKDSIGSCTDGVDNDFDGFIDMQDPGCK